MRTRIAIALACALAFPVWALTLAQVRTQADAYIDSIAAAARNRIITCLETQENCQTGWSCTTPCNTTAAAGSLCQTAQSDPGLLDQCGVATGESTFASRGITLPANAPVCFKLNVYSGPGGRGGNLCYRTQHAGTVYERCRGFGPQASRFSSEWTAVQ
jgi:hypothetical protein